VRVKHTW